jgi:hypothetical protein
VFNRGVSYFEFSATVSAPWIVLSDTHYTIEKDRHVYVSVDWGNVPKGITTGWVTIAGTGTSVKVKVNAVNPQAPTRSSLKDLSFVQADGYVSMEAEHFSRKSNLGPVHWDKLHDYGRTLSAMTVFPVTAISAAPPQSPHLEYEMYLFDPGRVEVEAILSPTLNFVPGSALRHFVRRPAAAGGRCSGAEFATRLGDYREGQRAQSDVHSHPERERISHAEVLDGGSRTGAGEIGGRSGWRQAELSRPAGELSRK